MNQSVIDEVFASISPDKPRGERFALPYSLEEMTAILRTAYAEQVRLRGAYDFKASPETERVISSVAKWMITPTLKPGLILMGATPGTGKTTAAKAIISATTAGARLLPERYRDELERIQYEMYAADDPATRTRASERNTEIEAELAKLRTRFPFFHFHTAQELEAARMSDEDSGEFAKICKMDDSALAPRPEIVVLDDVGTERRTIKRFGTEYEPFIEFLYSRYQSQRAVVLTSNLSGQMISDTYGPRVWDRLCEMCETISFKGGSFRK